MTEKQSKKYSFRYQLTYDEAYNAFLALAVRWSKRTKYGIMAALVVASIASMIMFAMDPERFYMFYVVIMCVVMTAYVFYAPLLKARKGAKQVARVGGTYEIGLTDDGKVVLAGQEDELRGDKNARALELNDSFAVRMNSYLTFCIPKRIMTEKEMDAVREILDKYVKFSVYDAR